jgi:succinate dehydrogenase / fumarate reductase cytochrome b subunit
MQLKNENFFSKKHLTFNFSWFMQVVIDFFIMKSGAKRPISPHLTIYKPMITSLSSILGRFAGVYTYLISVLVLISVAFAIQNHKYAGSLFVSMLDFTYSGALQLTFMAIFTFGSLFAFFLYIFACIRHLIWDFGYLLELCISKAMGYAMFGLSFMISLALTVFIFLF